MPYLIDSDVLIDISPGRQEAVDYVDTLADPWSISQVTTMELQVGARDKREVAYLDAFLSSYPVVPLSAAIGRRAYELGSTGYLVAPGRGRGRRSGSKWH